MIGIIGAMDMEVNGLKERMQNTEVETIGTIDFYKGTIQGIGLFAYAESANYLPGYETGKHYAAAEWKYQVN